MTRPDGSRKGRVGGCLDSLPVGKRAARYLAAAFLAALLVSLAGCGTDRSNLLSSETAAGLEAELDRIEGLVAADDCFAALDRAESARVEVESLRGEIDNRLRTTLLDGLTQLQVVIQDECAAETIEEVIVEEEQAETDTGGTAPEDQGGEQGGGGERPRPNPTPEPPPEPATPDSGGVTPGGVTPSPGGQSG